MRGHLCGREPTGELQYGLCNEWCSSIDTASKIEAMVRHVPFGRVATYGQIAKLIGLPKNARQVGTVLRSLPDDSDVPWHRVLNSQGKISERDERVFEGLQRHLLEEEGVEFDNRGRLDLNVFQWQPKN